MVEPLQTIHKALPRSKNLDQGWASIVRGINNMNKYFPRQDRP